MGEIQTEVRMSDSLKQQAEAHNASVKAAEESEKEASVKSPEEEKESEPAKDAGETTEKSDDSEKEGESEESDSEKGEDESKDESDESNKEDDEKLEAKSKRRKGFERRIEKLNARAKAIEEEAAYWKRKALEGEKSEKTDDEPKVKADESARPDVDDFETYDDYVEALTEYKAKQLLAAKDQESREKQIAREHEAKISSHNSRVEKYAKENPEYLNDLNDFIADEGEDYMLSASLEQSLVESENGPQLMHELLKDPEEMKRVNSLGPMGVARALGRIEARLESKATASKEEKKEIKKTKTTSAPAPISTVKAKGGQAYKDPSKMTMREYEAYRNGRYTR